MVGNAHPIRLLRTAKTAALGLSLVFSALLTAAALRLPDLHWLAWISFLPLFVVVRSLRPSVAALAGGLWGGFLYLFCTAGPMSAVQAITPTINLTAPAIGPSAWLFALLIVIPAVYVGLAARPARAIGFKLLILALGWTLIEVVLVIAQTYTPDYANILEPRALQSRFAAAHAVLQNKNYSDSLRQGLLTGSQGEGLLTGSQGDGLHFHWFASLLGYVCTAFLVACANASLVGILTGFRLSFPTCMSLGASPNAVGWMPSQFVLPIQSWTLRRAHPRAPPIPVALVR